LVQEDYPRTALDLVFLFEGKVNIEALNSEDIGLSKYSLLGLFDKKYNVKYTDSIKVIHVRFKPSGIYPLTKIPLKHSWKGLVDLEDLVGNEIKIVYDHIGNEPDIAAKINLLENFLVKRYNESSTHHKFNYCLDLINNGANQINVEQLAQAVNSNYKSLDRWFKKYVGATPKKYLQLNRFKNVLQSLENQPEANWMQLVVDYGFHDQSHFINHFKYVTGTTPTDYLANQNPTLNS